MKIAAERLAAHLAQQLMPAYLVSGEEPLLAGEAADAIRAQARARGYTEREVHFIERGTNWEELRGSTGNLSLFGSRRIVELRMPGGKPGVAGARALLAMLARADPDTLLLVLTERLDGASQNSEWVRALDTRGGWVAIGRLSPQRLPEWLRSRCRRAGLDAEPEAIELLAARTEGNLLAADQEISKLALLLPAGRLTREAIIDGVVDSSRYNVFELGGALAQGDAPRALRVLEGLRAEGEEPPLVLWSALQSLRRLAASGGGHAVSVGYSRLLGRALRVDRMIKGRLSGDAWDELALLAVELCGTRVLPPPGAARP